MKTLRQNDDERLTAVAREVVDVSVATLFVDMRFLDTALFRLKFEPDDADRIPTWYTDGERVFYNVRHLLGRYVSRQSAVTHDILHVVFHCVFRHMFVEETLDRRLWDIACDIAVEALIGSLGFESVRDERDALRMQIIDELPGDIVPITAEKLYRNLLDSDYADDDLITMARAFQTDEHLWYEFEDKESDDGDPDGSHDGEDGDEDCETGDRGNEALGGQGAPSQRDQLETMWQDAAKNIQTGLETIFGKEEMGAVTGDLLQALKVLNREHYDYRSFLRKFCTLGEVVQLDPEEFDHIFYTYGLELYADMPLIEPLEYREVRRLRDVAIVLDTSGSVSGDLVQHFLERTYDLITAEQSSFKRFRIHLIQCDSEVKEDHLLTSREDLDEYLEDMTLHGFGGTDYAPAFEYIDSLLAGGEFVDFKGVIYFTDGRGRFPAKPPAYQSAFVFMDDTYDDQAIPPWAIKLLFSTDEVRML